MCTYIYVYVYCIHMLAGLLGCKIWILSCEPYSAIGTHVNYEQVTVTETYIYIFKNCFCLMCYNIAQCNRKVCGDYWLGFEPTTTIHYSVQWPRIKRACHESLTSIFCETRTVCKWFQYFRFSVKNFLRALAAKLKIVWNWTSNFNLNRQIGLFSTFANRSISLHPILEGGQSYVGSTIKIYK